MSVPIPEDLQRRYSNTAERRAWLARLPQLLHNAYHRWKVQPELAPGQQPWNGFTGIAVPVSADDGSAAVIKISFPYEDIAHEPDTLKLWQGRGAVRLLQHDRTDRAMLLERLDSDRWLQSAPLEQAISVWGTLVRKLSISPDQRPEWLSIPSLAEQTERWNDELPQRWKELAEPFPRWLLEAALEVCQTRGAVSRRESHDVLVHADLHGMNILARPGTSGWQADDFLAIDPQGMVGEAEFSVMPMLSNRLSDLPVQNPELGLLDRLNMLCEAAGLDVEVARQWTIAREVEDALWYASKRDHQRDLNRSLWLSSTLAGRTIQGLPHPHSLEIS
ncbi:aminoglycoside phosphotransferase family protein [Psychromicrobium lacuslunae]|uniref:Aminoglycoside resistance protein n=1 Tax=Psychromicrobium lacuslunae TaxID=1618207 RepID=A0A0D4BW64_9MICC|nr:aminoglycoside phosphotransferase family protein [Psychromicrobium lacuslunae]AJT40544.1 aminoglycoside resistance protein [Psychromicrobium lacuslunae]